MRGLGTGSEVQGLGAGSGHAVGVWGLRCGVWAWGLGTGSGCRVWGVGSRCGVWARGLGMGCGVWARGLICGVWAQGLGAWSGVQGLGCQGRQPSSGAFCRFQPPHQAGRLAPTGDQETQIVKEPLKNKDLSQYTEFLSY